MSGPPREVARVFAPGSIGNLGPAFDSLGLAVAGLGDTVTARCIDGGPGSPKVEQVRIDSAGHPDLPLDPDLNSAGIAARDVLRRAGSRIAIALSIEKGLPLSAGLGGSAASAVAAAKAVHLLLGGPLQIDDLLAASLAGEAAVAGCHLDNVAPSLLGGAVLVRSIEPIDAIRLPVPPSLLVVLATPDAVMRTAEARRVLPRDIPRAIAIHQLAHAAALVAGLCTGDLELVGRAIDDRIAEPVRAPLLAGFAEAKAAALSEGALGASISGSGPTMFALAGERETAARIARAVEAAYAGRGIGCTARVAEVDRLGAREI